MIPHDDLLSQSGTTFSTVQAIRSVAYGDGYGQRATDGLNDRRRTGTLQWIPLTLTERNDIHNHWDQVGVVESFPWAAPDDIERTWRYTDGITETTVGDRYMLTVTVQEEFE